MRYPREGGDGDFDHGDMALFHLTESIFFSEYSQPICLPESDADIQQFKVCVATGFGQAQPYAGMLLIIVAHTEKFIPDISYLIGLNK